MNWIQAVASLAALALAAISGGNFAGMNQPGSTASLWQYLVYVGLPFLGAAGALGAALLWQTQPPAGVDPNELLRQEITNAFEDALHGELSQEAGLLAGLARIYWAAGDYTKLDILKTLSPSVSK